MSATDWPICPDCKHDAGVDFDGNSTWSCSCCGLEWPDGDHPDADDWLYDEGVDA